MEFLKEYWLWIVVPIALVVITLAVLLLFGSGTESEFIYTP